MTQSSPSEAVLRAYFHAKDENRPHLLDQVFTEGASLEVHNQSTSIAFPAATQGRAAIASVLVSDFNRAFENIYSFYLSRPLTDAPVFQCAWLVGMTDKASHEVRVGCGTYVWQFASAPGHLASALLIRIGAMQVLPPSDYPAVLSWLQHLSYPWTSTAEVLAHMPSLAALAPVLKDLNAREAAALNLPTDHPES